MSNSFWSDLSTYHKLHFPSEGSGTPIAPTAKGYEGVSGNVTYGPNGWEYSGPAQTPEQKAEARRNVGLRDIYAQYAEKLPTSEAQYYSGLSGDIAQQQYGDLSQQYGKALRASNQNLTNRGIMGSATVERTGDLMEKRNKARLGIAGEAQQRNEALQNEARASYGGMAQYYDALRQQETMNQMGMQEQALGSAYAGTKAAFDKWQVETPYLYRPKSAGLLFNSLATMGKMDMGGMFGGGGGGGGSEGVDESSSGFEGTDFGI